jgi:hypothetical protein
MPNWSFAVAVSCLVSPLATIEPLGEMLTVVATWLTVTFTLLVVAFTPSEIVTRSWYVPARVNVTVVFLAPLVPLAEKVTSIGCWLTASQEYRRFDSPPSSSPRTLRPVDAPLTEVDVAFAGRRRSACRRASSARGRR